VLVVALLVGLVLLLFVVIPLFERVSPPHVVRAYQRLSMPLFRASAGFVPGFAIVETIGRRTGKTRPVPVGGRLRGDEFWFVAGIGRRAGYVKNIEANSRVRVKALGRWRTGTATLALDDNATRRMFAVSPANGFFLWLAGGRHLSVRVDLDQIDGPTGP